MNDAIPRKTSTITRADGTTVEVEHVDHDAVLSQWDELNYAALALEPGDLHNVIDCAVDRLDAGAVEIQRLRTLLARMASDANQMDLRLVAVGDIHTPIEIEVEQWHDPDAECRAEGECPDDGGCNGHIVTIQSCSECGVGFDSYGEPVQFKWPCRTKRALDGPTAPKPPFDHATWPHMDLDESELPAADDEHRVAITFWNTDTGIQLECSCGWTQEMRWEFVDDGAGPGGSTITPERAMIATNLHRAAAVPPETPQ